MSPRLSPQQLAAIDDPSQVLQLVACAGAGKTEVLARRVARELERSDPAGIVAFTFTNKAASELRERIEQRSRETGAWKESLPPTAHGLFVGTIHAFCLDRVRMLSGRHEAFDILSEERQWSLAIRYARRLGIVDLYAEHRARDPGKTAAAPAVEVFLDNLDFVHNQRIPRDQLRAVAPRLAEVIARYEHLLDRMQLLSFGTVIERAADLLEEGAPLHRELAGRLSHVFVDEYQDLNPAQEHLLRRLHGLGARVTVVGDDDQAIYQWRGGDVDLFVKFPDRYAGAKRRALDQNHRSRASIVRTAASVAGRIPERTDKQMTPARGDDGPAVELFTAINPEDEAAHVARRIEHLIAQGHRPGDIAILCRSVRTTGGPLRAALDLRRIPFRSTGHLSLLSRPDTALVTRLLVLWSGGVWYPDHQNETIIAARLADDLAALVGVSKTEARKRIQRAVKMGEDIGRGECFDLVSALDGVLVELGLPGEGQDVEDREHGLGQLSRLLAEFEHAQRRAGPTARDLEEGAPSPDANEEDAEDAQLVPPESPEDAAERGPRSLRLGMTQGEILLRRLKSYLEAFGRQAVEQQPATGEDQANAVHLMTIHGSKGLEFPVVFIPAMVTRRFPSSLTGRAKPWLLPEAILGEARERYEGRVQDELRLFYVALTRAKQLAVVSTFGEPSRASPFLADLAPAVRSRQVAPFGHAQAEPLLQGPDEDQLDTDFSALAVYDECGFKYRLRYLCGFAPRIAPELGFGKLLHHLVAEVARAARAGETPSAALVDQLLERDFYLPFAGRMTKAQLRDETRKRVLAFIEKSGSLLGRTVAPEFPFEVPLSAARITGRIDLLARAEKGGPDDVALIDFKTTEDRPPSETHENQLRLYAEACRALGKNPVSLEIHDLRVQGGVHVVKDDPAQRDAFRTKLEGWVEGIREGRFEPCKGRKACGRCDFRKFCRWGLGDGGQS